MSIFLLKNTLLLWLLVLGGCGNHSTEKNDTRAESKDQVSSENNPIIPGANHTEKYLPLLKNKSVGIVANQTSVIFHGEKRDFILADPETNEHTKDNMFRYQHTHLVDSLLSLGVRIRAVFAPEHGFRGTADAGEKVKDGTDTKTGLPILSLYGDNKKPSKEQLDGIDIMIFDIQDVGARFYTYISTLHYIMEACAENNIPILVLDRPNPNGHYVDGPILEPEHKSFVGMHPVPVVHGMTIGEYAQMINGEGWLPGQLKCDLNVIKIQNYRRDMAYPLTIKPSPNLPNDTAINLYPSLCFFEGTNVNAGRGTSMQFQQFGSPFLDKLYFPYSYIPEPNEGAKYPKHNGKICYGKNLVGIKPLSSIHLDWLIDAYESTSDQSVFFNDFFTKLAGTEKLRKQIEQGWTAKEIKKSWIPGITEFMKKRDPYLIYD